MSNELETQKAKIFAVLYKYVDIVGVFFDLFRLFSNSSTKFVGGILFLRTNECIPQIPYNWADGQMGRQTGGYAWMCYRSATGQKLNKLNFDIL